MLKESQKVFYGLENLLKQSSQLDELFKKWLQVISKSFKVKRVSLMLLDEARKELFIHEAEGISPELKKNTRVKLGQGISGWVAEKGEGVLVKDIQQSPRFSKEKKAKGFSGGSFICVPLKVMGKVYGVLNVSEKKDGTPFHAGELSDLEIFGMQLALMLENRSLKKEIRWMEKKSVEEVAEVSHDFRIPLTCLEEVIHLISAEELGAISKKQHEFLNLAKRNVKRMIETFDHLIDIATSQAPRSKDIVQTDLKRMVKDLAGDFDAVARKKRVSIETKIPYDPCIVYTDARRIRDVIMNLIDNAIKYTKKKTKVSIKLLVNTQSKGFRLEVHDQGPGLTKKQEAALFDKKASIKISQAKGLEEGHGLGLAISHDILVSLQGSIGVKSRRNKGTVFFIEIPKKIERKRTLKKI